MILGSPMMLLGLLALPALAGIYWFRGRSRPVAVSSLLLWSSHRTSRHGGRKLERFQHPLVLLLELLALLLIVFAATNPAVQAERQSRRLIVVLDDSYSMSATTMTPTAGVDGESARERAVAAILTELESARYSTRFLLARAEPLLLSEAVESAEDAARALKKWQCRSSQADIARAVAMAMEIGSDQHQVLVVTDHAPPDDLPAGQVEWWSFGHPVNNLAFTAAARQSSGGRQRVLLEVANLSSQERRAELKFSYSDGSDGGSSAGNPQSPPPPAPVLVSIQPNGVRQVVLDIDAAAPALRAHLPADGLQSDNTVLLLPEQSRPLSVRVTLDDAMLRQAFRRAFEATGQVQLTNVGGDLVICDGPLIAGGGDVPGSWRMRVYGGDGADALAGPFMIDHRHPLCVGLSLGSVIWGAGSGGVAGRPIIMAGNTVLLDEQPSAGDGGRRLNIYFEPSVSTLQDSVDWPALIANLVNWRLSELPGVHPANVRLGQMVRVFPRADEAALRWESPSGLERELDVSRGEAVELVPQEAGLHQLRGQGEAYRFAVNVLSREESDVQRAVSGRWGDWSAMAVRQAALLQLGWIGWLGALAALAVRQALLRKAGGSA